MRAFEPLHPRLRIAALVGCAYGAVNRGLAYAHTTSTPFTTFVDALVPLQVWAWVWIGAGVAMLVGIWNRVVARYALSLGATLWVVWGVSFYASWLVGDQSRGWVTAGSFVAIGWLMFIITALADTVGPTREPVMADERVPT